MSVYSPVYSGTSIARERACARGATWKSWLKLAGRFGAPNFLIDFIRLPPPVAMMPRDLFSVLGGIARREAPLASHDFLGGLVC